VPFIETPVRRISCTRVHASEAESLALSERFEVCLGHSATDYGPKLGVIHPGPGEHSQVLGVGVGVIYDGADKARHVIGVQLDCSRELGDIKIEDCAKQSLFVSKICIQTLFACPGFARNAVNPCASQPVCSELPSGRD